jgi:hypothetical protein
MSDIKVANTKLRRDWYLGHPVYFFSRRNCPSSHYPPSRVRHYAAAANDIAKQYWSWNYNYLLTIVLNCHCCSCLSFTFGEWTNFHTMLAVWSMHQRKIFFGISHELWPWKYLREGGATIQWKICKLKTSTIYIRASDICRLRGYDS